jgi:hypothetical protein
MHPNNNSRFRRQVRGFYLWLGAIVLAAIGPYVANLLIHSDSAVVRVAGLVVGLAWWLPYFFVTVSVIKHGDEFTQRIHLVAASLAFAEALFVISAAGWLSSAHVMAPPEYEVVWVVCAALWVVTLVVVKRRYEARP